VNQFGPRFDSVMGFKNRLGPACQSPSSLPLVRAVGRRLLPLHAPIACTRASSTRAPGPLLPHHYFLPSALSRWSSQYAKARLFFCHHRQPWSTAAPPLHHAPSPLSLHVSAHHRPIASQQHLTAGDPSGAVYFNFPHFGEQCHCRGRHRFNIAGEPFVCLSSLHGAMHDPSPL
jgi:hypothetical protein